MRHLPAHPDQLGTDEGEAMKRVLKFATGDNVPMEGKYLWSCVQLKANGTRYVWHYFEVEQ